MSFQYAPLDAAADEIRLLTLHPGQQDHDIRCDVRNVSLDDYSVHDEGIYRWSRGGFGWERPSPDASSFLTGDRKPYNPDEAAWSPLDFSNFGDSQDTHVNEKLPQFRGKTPDMTGLPLVPVYEALSYTWGNASVKVPIEVNGSEFLVTTNLFSALKCLRKETKERVLWIDAICINQDNVKERSDQVQRMRSIYQRAKRVVIWLGDAANNSSMAMELLEKLGGREKDLPNLDFGEWYGPQFNHFGGVGDHKWRRDELTKELRKLDLIGPADLDSTGWAAIEHFLKNREYWTRAWIVQEIAYARSIKIYCGPSSMGWESFTHVGYNDKMQQDPILTARFCRIVNEARITPLIGQHEQTREVTRSFGFEKQGTSLLEYLDEFRDHQSTDPRDKVYAFLGLASIGDDMPFHRPDYEQSVCAIYCETVRSIINYERRLDVLCLEHSNSDTTQYGLPSWAPDWTRRPMTIPLMSPSSRFRYYYQASGKSLVEGPDFQFEYETGKEGRRDERNDGSMHLRGTDYFRRKDGLAHRRFEQPISVAAAADNSLALHGIKWDVVLGPGEPVTETGLKDGTWRNTVRQWESMFNQEDLTRRSHPNKLPPLADLYWTILKGRVPCPAQRPGVEWREVLFEKILIWSGRLTLAQARQPELMSQLGDIDHLIKQSLPGWRFAMTARGLMSMVPTRAAKGDVVAVMFGADVPLVLRPVPDQDDQFLQIGTAYVHGIMDGEVMDELQKG